MSSRPMPRSAARSSPAAARASCAPPRRSPPSITNGGTAPATPMASSARRSRSRRGSSRSPMCSTRSATPAPTSRHRRAPRHWPRCDACAVSSSTPPWSMRSSTSRRWTEWRPSRTGSGPGAGEIQGNGTGARWRAGQRHRDLLSGSERLGAGPGAGVETQARRRQRQVAISGGRGRRNGTERQQPMAQLVGRRGARRNPRGPTLELRLQRRGVEIQLADLINAAARRRAGLRPTFRRNY